MSVVVLGVVVFVQVVCVMVVVVMGMVVCVRVVEVVFFIFHDFSFVFVNMGSYGRQYIKTLLLPPITFESFQTFFLNFFFSVVLTKALF